MTAQTFNSTKAGPGAKTPHYIGAGVVLSQYVKFPIPEAPEVADVYALFYLPKGAIPIGGYAAATDIDTGTETFDMDIGIAANGVDAADPDFFTNSGLWSGDSPGVDAVLTNAASKRDFTGPFPVEQLGAKTLVQAVVNAVAAAGGTGSFVCRVDYLMPGEATS